MIGAPLHHNVAGSHHRRLVIENQGDLAFKYDAVVNRLRSMHQRMAGNPDSSECVPTADTLELLSGSAHIEVTCSAFRLKIADSNPRAPRRRCESPPRLRRHRAPGRFAGRGGHELCLTRGQSPFAPNELSRVSSTHRSALAPSLVDLTVRLEGVTLRIQAHVPVLADLAEDLRPLVSPHQGTELPVPHPRNPVVIQVVRVAGIFGFSAVWVVDVAVDGRRDAVPREATQTLGDRIFPSSLRHNVDAQHDLIDVLDPEGGVHIARPAGREWDVVPEPENAVML